MISQEYIAIGAPLRVKEVFSNFYLDFPVAKDEVILIVTMSAVETVSINKGFLIQVTYESLWILFGNEYGFGIEALLREGTDQLRVLQLCKEENVIDAVYLFVEV